MKKYAVLLLLIISIPLYSQATLSPYAGIGVNFGFSTWNAPIPALCIGTEIFNWCSIDLQLGSVVFGNQVKISQNFHLMNLVRASNELSCFFYGSRPFLTYAVNLGLDISVFGKASIFIGTSYVVWDRLMIDESDSIHDFMRDNYPQIRWNLSVFYTARIFQKD